MPFKTLNCWNWAETYGYESYSGQRIDDPETEAKDKLTYKEFQKKVFIESNFVGEKIFYINCKSPLVPLKLSGNSIQNAWGKALELGHFYGGIIPTIEDITLEGFNFYSPDKKDKVFVKFNELERIIYLCN